GFLRLGLYLLPQADNLRIHGARSQKAIVAPDFLEQTIAAEGLPRMAEEVLQQFELLGGEIHRLALARHLATAQIYLDITKRVSVLFFGNGMRTAEDG